MQFFYFVIVMFRSDALTEKTLYGKLISYTYMNGGSEKKGIAMIKKLPVGVDGFEKIRTQGFYYVDKSLFIAELLEEWGEVNLFTRPRRFGKTLTMDMLKAFFEIGTDRTLFDGLKISQKKELCEKYMGQFPVISLTLKSVEGRNFQEAFAALRRVIGSEALRFSFLLESPALEKDEKELYKALIQVRDGKFTMDREILIDSLRVLSVLLSKHYQKKVILLIDEYDVPLDKAFHNGHYEAMISLIRNLFSNALKTNPALYFSVITGCLRITRESIFTGLNNLNTMSVTDEYFSSAFGFTEDEVLDLLTCYGQEDAMEIMKNWYNGYRFGDASIYCPWDVIKYTQALRKNRNAIPENYWANTSGNDMVRRFIDKADRNTKDEIEQLMAGGTIEKEIKPELTYRDLDNSIDNLWSVLFTTGYLTWVKRVTAKVYQLKIPNAEIHDLFASEIMEWFQDRSRADQSEAWKLCREFLNGDPEAIQKRLNRILAQTISILDTAAREEQKENFYHGILLGLLRSSADWLIVSNAESGDGFSDILIEPEDPDTGIIIEVKYASGIRELEKACGNAIRQIKDRRYDERLRNDGRTGITAFGIAFHKKRCKVLCEIL